MYHLLKALELDPKNPKAAYLHSKLLLDQGSPNAAVDFINSYLAEFGSHPDLHKLLALAYLQIGMIEKAEESISQALIQLPRSTDILHAAFRIKKAKGDKFSAFHFLERIIRHDDQSVETYWEMAQLLDPQTEAEKRINVLEISYSIDSKNFKIFKELLISYCDWFEGTLPLKEQQSYKKTFFDHTQSTFFLKLPQEVRKRSMLILKNIT